MIAGPLAWIVLSGAAARVGLVPRWVVAGAIVFMISDSLPIPAAEEIQSLIGIATFGTIALRMLSSTTNSGSRPHSPSRPCPEGDWKRVPSPRRSRDARRHRE
jgi:hypothetical protein